MSWFNKLLVERELGADRFEFAKCVRVGDVQIKITSKDYVTYVCVDSQTKKFLNIGKIRRNQN